jgi:TatD DNase family protein
MLLDAHTHLDHYSPEELSAVLSEIAERRVLSVAVAMNPQSYRRTCEIALREPLVLPCFGVHPWEAYHYIDHLATLEPLIAESPLLGEIGLDYVWDEDPAHYPAQREVFALFLRQATTQNKIVNLHTKGAEHDVIALLDQFAIQRAIVHWYSGPPDAFAALVSRGCWFTFGVETPYNPAIQEFARAIPLDRLLTETDGPEGLRWLNGQVGMPHHIHDVLVCLAELRGSSVAELRSIVAANWQRLSADDERLIPWNDW